MVGYPLTTGVDGFLGMFQASLVISRWSYPLSQSVLFSALVVALQCPKVAI